MLKSPHGRYSTQKNFELAIDELIIARFPTATALRENADVVVELLRDSIESFSIRIGLSTPRFAEAYSSAIRMTIATINKPFLRGVCRFQKLPASSALRWLKSRLLNNIKTVLTNPKSAEWLGHFDREEAKYVTFGNAEMEAELAGLSREDVEKGLKALFLEGADIGELEYLAYRLDIDLDSVIGSSAIPVICEKTENGNAQMAFDWGV